MQVSNLFFKSFIVIGILMFSQSSFSQTTNVEVIDSTSVEKRLKFGIGFGLSFVGGTNVNLAPNLTYKISDKFSVGGGLQGSYSAIKDLQSTFTAGVNIFGLYNPIPKITTILELAELWVLRETETTTGKVEKEFWDAALFIGAGYNITNKISVGAKYNVLYKEDESVYTSPIIPFVNISF